MTVSTDLHTSVKTKVEELINRCEHLQNRNEDLVNQLSRLDAENARLHQVTENLNTELTSSKQQIMELNHRVEILKNAETLSRSDEKSAEVKSRINDLMREIDNCIALLSK